ncbi:DUF636 domain-containing protein [Agrocybe pediades]|nr:DUF636 domain-containing protein [Agrocybe pediades]
MSQPTTYHASCLCKGVKFNLEGEPFHFVICHCSNCKKVSGSAFMVNAMYKPERVMITQGKELIKEYADGETLSGNTIKRTFCGNCGSTLLIIPSKGDINITHPSLIEEKVNWVPKKEFHGQDKYSWVKEITFKKKEATKSKL